MEVDSKLSADKQVSDIDSMITRRFGGITSWTLDPGAADAVYKRARAANIPVIGLNSTSKYFNSSIQGYTDATCRVSQQQAQFIRSDPAREDHRAGRPARSVDHAHDKLLPRGGREGRPGGARVPEEPAGLADRGSTDVPDPAPAAPGRPGDLELHRRSVARSLRDAQGSEQDRLVGKSAGIIVVARNGTSAAAEAIRTGNMTATWDNNQPLVGAAALQVLKYLIVDKVKPRSCRRRSHPVEALGSEQHRDVQEPRLAVGVATAACQVQRSQVVVRPADGEVHDAVAVGAV